MKSNIYYHPSEWRQAQGICVVIDVLRAFTTAAFAFSKGARSITFVSSSEEAFERFRQDDSLVLMGEENGHPIKGFHFGNSPYEIGKIDLGNRNLIQHTSAGTQGVVSCRKAERLLVSSFCVAEATWVRLLELNPKEVSFIVTGQRNGDEDRALAEYLEARLLGEKPDIEPYLTRVRNSPEGRIFQSSQFPHFDPRDLELALEVNRFSFAMEIEKNLGSYTAIPVQMGAKF